MGAQRRFAFVDVHSAVADLNITVGSVGGTSAAIVSSPPPQLPPRLLAALQRQAEARLESAQEGTDVAPLTSAIDDACVIGLPVARIAEARRRFQEVREATERQRRRERRSGERHFVGTSKMLG